LQFVKDGVPYCWQLESTVQIHGETSLPNEDGFCSPPLAVVGDHLFHLGTFPINVGDHLFHLGTFPINVVVILLYMYSDAIPVITSPYSLSVLSESVPLGLAYVYLVTTFAGDLVHYRSLLLLWYLLLHVDQRLPHGVGWLEDSFDPKSCVVFSTPCKKDADLLMIITNNINGTQPPAI